VTKQEAIMFRQGWVSAQMAAARLGVHVVTIHRLVEKLPERDKQMVGRRRFIRMTALAEAHEPHMRRAFRLDDWSDLLPEVERVAFS
jgi:hypothetical protein